MLDMDRPKETRGIRTDLNRSAVSRYIQLATLFRRRIESGQWPLGDQIPTIDALAVDCGVARATIRHALGMLEAEGLVERFRAKGTFVRRRPQDQLLICDVETDWSGLLNAREGALIEVLSEETGATPRYMPHAIGEVSTTYRHLRRLHSQNGVPFLIADVYLDESLSKKISSESFQTKTALRLAASLPGVQIIDARQTITISTADIETAERLKVALNAPVVHVNRSAVDQRGVLILISNGIYRGDVVRLDFKLR
jgi:GntR family transcriptional regulator